MPFSPIIPEEVKFACLTSLVGIIDSALTSKVIVISVQVIISSTEEIVKVIGFWESCLSIDNAVAEDLRVLNILSL